MKDFINHIAYMISESGDVPSYDDIYTICKKLGKEPDENTMTRDEYYDLDDSDHRKIHDVATSGTDPEELPPDIDSATYWTSEKGWKKFTKKMKELDRTRARYDDEGLPVDPDERKRFLDKKTSKKRKVAGDLNAFLFVCETAREFGDKYDLGPGGADDEGRRVQGQTTKPTYSKVGTMMFETVEEAYAELEARKKNIAQKLGFDVSAFKDIPFEALPHEIKDQDLDAHGELFMETYGEGKKIRGKRGPKAKNSSGEEQAEVIFDKKTKEIFVEYIVYQSESFIKSSGDALTAMAKEISET